MMCHSLMPDACSNQNQCTLVQGCVNQTGRKPGFMEATHKAGFLHIMCYRHVYRLGYRITHQSFQGCLSTFKIAHLGYSSSKASISRLPDLHISTFRYRFTSACAHIHFYGRQRNESTPKIHEHPIFFCSTRTTPNDAAIATAFNEDGWTCFSSPNCRVHTLVACSKFSFWTLDFPIWMLPVDLIPLRRSDFGLTRAEAFGLKKKKQRLLLMPHQVLGDATVLLCKLRSLIQRVVIFNFYHKNTQFSFFWLAWANQRTGTN